MELLLGQISRNLPAGSLVIWFKQELEGGNQVKRLRPCLC